MAPSLFPQASLSDNPYRLLNAVQRRHVSVEHIRQILAQGDRNVIQVAGRNSLHMALSHGAPMDVVESLYLAWNQYVCTMDVDGALPLHVACRAHAPTNIVRFLVDKLSESVLAKDTNGMLPLHCAFRFSIPRVSTIRYLVSIAPTTVKVTDNFGNTALHYACSKKLNLREGADQISIIRFLVQSYPGAVNVLNKNNKNPMQMNTGTHIGYIVNQDISRIKLSISSLYVSVDNNIPAGLWPLVLDLGLELCAHQAYEGLIKVMGCQVDKLVTKRKRTLS